jgi:nucleoside-diphosphate-sugar epimerase
MIIVGEEKIVLLGGAGLVGQNLVIRLVEAGYHNILVIDKSRENLSVLRRLNPQVQICCADLSEDGEWRARLKSGDVIVMLQAQIGGLNYDDFAKNNVVSTRLVLETMKQQSIQRLVHVSSSVVNSVADDWYVQTKSEQEKLVLESNLTSVVLRPTLMFGWFDRKHLGWLSRFMKRVPVFPIPGHGRYLRQPLYVGDFANILLRCIEDELIVGTFDITGQEKINYIEIITMIRSAVRARSVVIRIPFWLFRRLLVIWSKFDSNPPFTAQQLEALVAPDEFKVIDWPRIFNVEATTFSKAIDETFNNISYSSIVLEF